MKENKLIAEFMGLKYYEPFFEVTDESQMEKIEVRKGKAISFGYMFEPHELRYHESWDWLKPVIDKVEQVHEGVPQELINLSLFSTIDEVYNAVVEFINQYNKENESND